MTKREMMEMVIAGNITDEVIEMAKAEITKMDARNSKRSSEPSKRAKENEPIKAKIVEYLTGQEEPTLAKIIGEAVEISTQKASALCRQMVNDGTLTVVDVKVKGKGVQKGYKVAQITKEENASSLLFFL